jgi:2-polyprenyl-3-methyl-5-hydroxy-6-metoxy-1,4-benzoquinol methylase
MADMKTSSIGDGLDVVARQLREARDRYVKRLAVYRLAGYDRPAAVRFVVDQAEGFSGPILDVGSGQGMLAMEFARRGFEVVSVDVNPEEQLTAILNAQLEGLPGRITFMATDARRVPFRDGAFAAAAAMDALHHLAEGPLVFAEMVRVVRPSGRILLAEFDRRGLEIVARVHRSEGRDHPVGPVTFADAVAWFVASGLNLELRREGSFHSIAVFSKPQERVGAPHAAS